MEDSQKFSSFYFIHNRKSDYLIFKYFSRVIYMYENTRFNVF